jgi:hypothetical protein
VSPVSATTWWPTTLTGTTVVPLGDRMVLLATISWSLGEGDGAPTLVSDFLLQRDGGDGVRCVAYLPRTTVLDHVDRGAARERPSTPRRRAAVGTLGP